VVGFAHRQVLPALETRAVEYEVIDVTSRHRPKPSWRFTDGAGHRFRWHDSRGPAGDYDPIENYHVQGTRLVAAEGEDGDADSSLYHLVCEQCGAAVEPGYTADWRRRYIRV
jgi:hypothetical protein